MLRRAAQSLLLIDKSKRERTGDVQIGVLEQLTAVISEEISPTAGALAG